MTAVPVSVRTGRSLAPMQRSLWMSQRRHPDAPLQNMVHLSHIDGAIDPGPFLLGPTMSVADVYVAMLFIWYRGEIDAPRLAALTDGVRRHPTVAPIWRSHFGNR